MKHTASKCIRTTLMILNQELDFNVYFKMEVADEMSPERKCIRYL